MSEKVPDIIPSVSDQGVSGQMPQIGFGIARHDDPRYKVAGILRSINSLIVAAPMGDEALNAAADALEDVRINLESAAEPGRRPRVQPDPDGDAQDFFPTSPAIGLANPIASPVKVDKAPGGLRGRAWFDYQYEGPPGCVHGGVIALVFDELLGAANIAERSPGMTGTLTIRYRRPTPIRKDLTIVARFEGRDGRKIRAWGGIYDGEELTAEAEGIFIELSPDRFFSTLAKFAEGSAFGQSTSPSQP
jgi:acyl-coenzyme A thioesterase PaaI-like protein